jgi:hypothetical protein
MPHVQCRFVGKLSAQLCRMRRFLPALVRILMVAATKRGLLPTNDKIEDARMVADIMKEGNGESMAKRCLR